MPSTSTPIYVTGASGFIATELVSQLLDKGYSVRGTVRSLKNEEKLKPLREITPVDNPSRLELVEADLMVPNAFDESIKGCEIVIHTASPFVLSVKDPQRDLVDPAISGTKSVLQACTKADSVKLVVLTSSIAAISDAPSGIEKPFTENDWNHLSSLTRNPYYFSKKLAEEAAWSFMEDSKNFLEGKEPFKLVVINPGFVIGPSRVPSPGESAQPIIGTLNGQFPGLIDLHFPFVDVRDVAKAHILAFEEKASGRYICVDQDVTHERLVSIIREQNNKAKLPRFKLPNILVKSTICLQEASVANFLRLNVGKGAYRFENSKIVRDFGFQFIPVETSITDTVNSLVKWGHVHPH